MQWQYEQGRIYSLDDNEELIAETIFFINKLGEMVIRRTFVIETMRGQGIAGVMMKAVAEYARENSLKIRPACSYAKHWLEQNDNEFADIMATL